MSNFFSFVSAQEHSTTSQYRHYVSKKALLKSDDFKAMPKEFREAVTLMKNGFDYHVHISGSYMVITLYFSRDMSYTHLAICVTTGEMYSYTSIKEAKAKVSLMIAEAKDRESATDKPEENPPEDSNTGKGKGKDQGK